VTIIQQKQGKMSSYFRVRLIFLEKSSIETVAATSNTAKISQVGKTLVDEEVSGEEIGKEPVEVPTVMFAFMAWQLICG